MSGQYKGMVLVDDIGFTSVNYGCTDPFANNYDSTATTDDGSCLYVGCLDASMLTITVLLVMLMTFIMYLQCL